MKTHIALLRGINVGGNNILPMKELVSLMEASGYKSVKTYIQSGNIVYQSEDNDNEKLSSLIEQKFGFKPYVFVLSIDEFKRAMNNCPYQSDQGKEIHYFFLEGNNIIIDHSLLESLKADSEQYQLIDNVFYLYAPDGIGRSKLVEKIAKAFPGTTMTARNLNTINKLAGMIEE